jgi:hypothetical protein
MVVHESLAPQLLSAMAALAEFDAEVEKLFSYHNLEEGKFTVRLFDLPSQKWKEAIGRAASRQTMAWHRRCGRFGTGDGGRPDGVHDRHVQPPLDQAVVGQ